MEKKSLVKQTISGSIWKFSERLLAQAVSFVVSIILARLLMPEDYGLIALSFIFITLCDKIVVCGFATSLIQKKGADGLDFSSVLYFSLFAATVLYILIFFTAPFVADFYSNFDKTQVVSVIRVLGLSLFVVAFNSVQHAYVSKNMLFKRYFFSTLSGSVVSGIVGLVMACRGYGVWALVAQNLTMSITDALVLFCTVKWRPTLTFSLNRLSALFSFGWRIFVASMLKTLYNEIRGLVIAKAYTPSDLAYYNKGQSLPQLVDSNVSGTIDSVLFPAYSKLQNDLSAMKSALRRSIKTSCYILMPLLAVMAALSDQIIIILLTDKWLPSAYFFQIFCFSFMLSPVEMENLQSLKAIGRSDVVLRLEIAKRIIGLLILVISVPFGIYAIAYGFLISALLAAILNAYTNSKFINYFLVEQIRDVFPSFVMSIVLFLAAFYFIKLTPNLSVWSQFLSVSSVSMIAYITISKIFGVESFVYIERQIKSFFRKNEH